MAGKKTGLYLSPIAEEIVNKVAEKYGYTKVSNTVNFIILEYSKMIKETVKETPVNVEMEMKPTETVKTFSDWFVAEEK